MNHLIKSWRKRAREINVVIKQDPNGWLVHDRIAQRNMLLRCAKELAKVDSFKFCVGDEVSYGSFKLIVTSRHESLVCKELKRHYRCNNGISFTEDELS